VTYRCQACDADTLEEIGAFTSLPRVTSDSKPFRPGGRLFVCADCGLTQKVADPQWLAEIAQIYAGYEMYHQSAALDQAVFVDGQPIGRCELLARKLSECGVVAQTGTLLDVGAGSGAMLAAFSAMFRDWKLYGLDLDDRKQASLARIPGFQRLFTVPPDRIEQQFDMVSLIHSLEHFTEPKAMLHHLRMRLRPGGRLFVQINNAERMPFDLVVADHLCHFTPRSVAGLAARAGFGTERCATDWISKEISVIATAQPGAEVIQDDASSARARVASDVAWLKSVLEDARSRVRHGRFGVFGSSVAATWLAAGLGEAVEFFVDEDPGRENRSHLQRPILRPDQVPPGSIVYLAFVRETADSIRRRLAGASFELAAPPPVR